MKQQSEKPALELIEEATHLLRAAPASVLCVYYLGSLPFVLAVLYFWSDMSRSAFAQQRLPVASLVLALALVWMKTWQSGFTHGLRTQLCGEDGERLTRAAWMRVALGQAVLQPLGLVTLPVAFVLAAPFPWVYAFHQNVTALATVEQHSVGALCRLSWRQARLWTSQNFSMLMVMQFFALFVFLDVFVALAGIPFLLDRFLGIPTLFTQTQWAVLNSTFLAAVVGLTYLCLDPLLKAIYVLRCFYGEGLQSGADLKAELRRWRTTSRNIAALVLACATVLITSSAEAAAAKADHSNTPNIRDRESGVQQPASSIQSPEAALNSPALDHSIDRTLAHREFTWRLPRETARTEPGEKGLLAGLIQGIAESLEDAAERVGIWMGDAFRWIRKLLRLKVNPNPTPGDWTEPIRALLVFFVVALLAVIGWCLYRVWRQRKLHSAQNLAAQPFIPVPDLADENVGADQLPEDGWMKLAHEFWQRGELRLALRALYLSSLAHLAGRSLIALARFKSNLDYERELSRRAHALPGLLDCFRQNVFDFDRVWYGQHEVNGALLDQFAHNVERIKERESAIHNPSALPHP